MKRMMTITLMLASVCGALLGGPLPADARPLAVQSAESARADSLYRAARTALNAEEYDRAARLFRELRERYDRSPHVPDSYYWEAYALYRRGGTADLRRALDALERQLAGHPDAATRADAEMLLTRIRGVLARQGDAEAAESVTRQAEAAARMADRAARAERAAPRARNGTQVTGGDCPGERNEERMAALNALLHMNPERALPIVKQVLERRDECSAELRRKAVFLLTQKGGDETEALLVDVARSDPDPDVRRQAVFWLSTVPTERAVDALEDILRNSDDPVLRERAVFALSQHDSDRAARLLTEVAERSDWPEDLRGRAIFWLGQRGTPESREFLRGLYGRIQEATLKEKILFGMAQSGDEARDWLYTVSSDAGEPLELRKKAIFWLSQSGAVDEIVALYDRTDEREIREQVIFGLSQRSEEAALEKLMEIARSDPEPELRKKAIFWLGQSDDPRVVDFLMELIGG